MKRIHVSMSSYHVIERRILLGLGRFATEQTPKWRIEWGASVHPQLLSRAGSFDAAIVWRPKEKQIPALSVAEIPVIGTSAATSGLLPYSVVPDNEMIGRQAALFFNDRGYRKAILLGHPVNYARSRFQAFRESFKGEVTTIWMESSNWLDQSESEALKHQIETSKPPIAIFSDNDWQASKCIQFIDRLGFRIPRDFAIVGVDNDEFVNLSALIPITSIDPAYERVGYESGRLISELLETPLTSPNSSRRLFVPPGKIHQRRSSDHFASEDPIISKASRIIQDEASQGLSVDELATRTGVGRRTLERRFKLVLGRGAGREIQRQKLNMAAEQLRSTEKTVSEIAESCHFSSLYQFSNAFKIRFGESPSQYRQLRKTSD